MRSWRPHRRPRSRRLYAIILRSMTGGRGRFEAVHDHYDVLPRHLEDGVKKAKANAHK